MDAGRFDALVRSLTDAVSRRTALGLTFSAAFSLSLGLADTEAKKKRKRKKKRCKRPRAACTPGGKRKCCHGLPCDEVLGHPGFFCCKTPHTPCSDDAECCGNRTCDTVFGASGTFCCGSAITTPCEIDADCCTGFGCFEGFCKPA